jgi:hypothetical protein
MHEAWMGFDTQILKGGKQAVAGRKAKTEQLNSWVGQWKMKYEQVYAFSQIGALMGKQWVLAWKIINGNYPSAKRDKHGNPIKLATNSQLNLIPGMSEGEGNMLMQRVIDGSLDRGDLRKECLKRNAFEEMRKCAIDIINTKTRSDRDIKEGKFTCSKWDDVETKFPVVANKRFLDAWIVSFVGKKKKAPVPAAFITAIAELLDNMAKKLVLRDSKFCQKPPYLAEYFGTHYCQPNANVVALGSGAGGDVQGLMNSGFKVHGIEQDQRQ